MIGDVNPNTRPTSYQTARYAKNGDRVHYNLFEHPHVASDVHLKFAEAKDGIGHKLTGAVIGDVAATVSLPKLNAKVLKRGDIRQQILLGAGTPAYCDDRIMFNQNQRRRTMTLDD